jgi:RNA polymerase sigma-70 factor (ECF subfamily)
LVERAAAGDAAAFAELVRRHQRRVYAVAYSVLGDPDLAWDAAQECFLKLFRRLSTFRGEAPLKAWLSRVALHVALDARRSRVRCPELPFDVAAFAALPDRGELPDERACLREDGERLGQAFAALGELQRSVLTLRELEGLSYAEIAEAMAIPVGTVMSRLFYARRALREQMESLQLRRAA